MMPDRETRRVAQSCESVPVPAPTTVEPPSGVGFRLATSTRVRDNGRLLLAGDRVLHLTPAAADLTRRTDLVAGDGAAAARLTRVLLHCGAADPWWPTAPPRDDAVLDVTVVIPVRDRPAALKRLLAALPEHMPVVVVDDGSRDFDATRHVCATHRVHLLRHLVSQGPAAARNTGLRAVLTPFVAFCDSDIEPVSGWLGSLRRHLDDPTVAAVAPRVLGRPAQPADGWLSRYERARSSLDLGPQPAEVRVRGRVAYLPSAALVVRVASIGRGFDPSLRSGEDVDLVWRLLEAGWRARYAPESLVRHEHRTTWGAWLARKAFYGTSAAPLAVRHRNAVAPVVLSPWSAAFTAAVLMQRRWSWALALAVAGGAARGVSRRLPPVPHPWRTATVLVGLGAGASVRQAGSSLLRHHWPIAVLGSCFSSRVRRAVVVAAVADTVLDYRQTRPDLGLAAYAVARRLDDLGYGSGLWLGCWRERSVRALLPHLRGKSLRRGRD